jgi:nitrite reductase (NADH) small subunit
MSWVQITTTEQIPLREGRCVDLGSGREIALFNLGDKICAIDNACPHKNGPLADGIVGGTTVTCPLHNWRISLESGAVLKPGEGEGMRVATYPVEVRAGVVWIDLPEGESVKSASQETCSLGR